MKSITFFFSIMVCCIFFSPALKGQVKKDSLKGKSLDTVGKAAPIQLKEVVIKTPPIPIKMKGDTISYNAKAFKTRINSTVQDLLKKLPGLQVDEQGRITFQGKGIEKIYIDGKDYYLNDPRLISQNLTADMIERIEVFDARSKRNQLSGLKDPDPGKAINLKLKAGVNLDFTGKVYGGYGSRKGYGTGATGSSFVKSRAITGSLASNNINDLTENNRLPFSSYGRSWSDKAALQYSDSWGKKLKANLEYHGTGKRTENRNSNSNWKTFLTDSTLLESHKSENTGKTRDHGLRGSWELLIDSTSMLNVESSINSFKSNDKGTDDLSGIITSLAGNYTGSSGSTANNSSSVQFDASNGIRYSQKFKKRTISFDVIQAYSRANQEGSFHSGLALYAPNGSLLESRQTDQQYTQANRHNEYSARFEHSEFLKSGHFLNTGYQYQSITDRIDKRTFNYNSLSGKYDQLDSLTTGDFINGTTKHRANLAYVRNGDKVNFSLGIAFEQNTLDNSDVYRETRFKRGFTALLPSASFSYNLPHPQGGRRFIADYSSRSWQPVVYQLQRVTDNRNPLQLIIGNPDLKQQLMHQFALTYSGFNTRRMRNFSIGLRTVYEQHSIVATSEVLTGGVQKVSYVNMEGKYMLASEVTYELPLGKVKKGRLRFNLEPQYENSPALLNGNLLVLRGFSTRQKTEFWYRAWDKLELNAEGRLAWQVARYSGKSELNSSGLIQNYRVALGLDLPFNMLLKSDYSLQLIGSQAGLAASCIFAWNASLLKNILKSGRGELKVSAFDLLNSNSGFFQRVGPGFIQQTSSNVLGRLVLLSFIYHLRKVPQEKEQG